MKKLSLLIIFVSFSFAKPFIGGGITRIDKIKVEYAVTGNSLHKKITGTDKGGFLGGFGLVFGYEKDYYRIYGSLERINYEETLTYIDTKNTYDFNEPMNKILFNFDLKKSFFHPFLEFYGGLSIGYGIWDISNLKFFEKDYKNLSYEKFSPAHGLIIGTKVGAIFSINANSKIDFSYKIETTSMKSKGSLTINNYTRNIDLKIKSMSTMSLAYIYKF